MDDRQRYRLDFADRLKVLREERGLSRSHMCKMAGLSVGAVENYEAARTLPNAYALMHLAWALAVDANELVGSLEMEEVG